jgi:putative acetyltransferase
MGTMTNLPHSELKIRSRESADWLTIAAICREQSIEMNPLELPYFSDEYAHKVIGDAPDSDLNFGLVAEADGIVVGAIDLQRGQGRTRHSGVLQRFVVAQHMQGRGVGSALLGALVDLGENWLNLTRLRNIIAVDNSPAISLHRKYGFVIEGKLRDYSYRNGRYVDAYLVARVRDV